MLENTSKEHLGSRRHCRTLAGRRDGHIWWTVIKIHIGTGLFFFCCVQSIFSSTSCHHHHHHHHEGFFDAQAQPPSLPLPFPNWQSAAGATWHLQDPEYVWLKITWPQLWPTSTSHQTESPTAIPRPHPTPHPRLPLNSSAPTPKCQTNTRPWFRHSSPSSSCFNQWWLELLQCVNVHFCFTCNAF